ncbi:MAG: AAA family ATPase [Nitrospina sp.]|jgi:general secretion pathway protein A|nr:AAA family ATPase [Nitrospina sp.]MBT5633635.1 AAA family ATPase [Nitrospina sp.]
MITEVQDYYQLLGVQHGATQKEIDLAYQKLISQFDSSERKPVSVDQPTLKERIEVAQEAYDTLSHEQKREAYDAVIEVKKGHGVSEKPQGAKSGPLKFLGIKDNSRKSKHQNVYQDFFGFSEKPFDLTPDPKYLYLSPKHKEVLAHLVYGLQENNGFLKIIGEVGTGKTMICRSFLRELRADFNIAYIFNPCINELELLQTINAELGLPGKSKSKKKLVDVLNRFLLEERAKGHRVVVIIDEAQDLATNVLEQLRLLSNLETDTEKLIQIVLIGQPELDKVLAKDGLRQLRQRITIKWELLPLNLEETRGYIQHRLNVALGKGKVRFSRQAVEMVYRYSRGIPRMINVVADRTLLIAYTQSTKKITPKIVKLAVSDIGELVPLESWADKFWKLVLPSGLAAGLIFFAINFFALPDYNKNASGEKDISALIQENPMDLSTPGELVPRFSAPSTMAVQPAPVKAPVFSKTETVKNDLSAPQRRIPSNGPLSVLDPEKLVTYLSSLTLVESKLEAVKWILEAWHIDPGQLQGLTEADLEMIEEDYQLASFEVNGTLERLKSLNYPALLEIALPNAQGTKYLALVSIQGDTAVFGSVDKIKMPLSVIDSLWTRKAIIPWKDFENLPESLGIGYKGKEAIWLQKNLRLLGYFQGREAPLYGPKTVQAMMKLQRNNSIKDDGIFNTDSKLLLYNLLQIYSTPRLVTQ